VVAASAGRARGVVSVLLLGEWAEDGGRRTENWGLDARLSVDAFSLILLQCCDAGVSDRHGVAVMSRCL
jgi:hypothetical protein